MSDHACSTKICHFQSFAMLPYMHSVHEFQQLIYALGHSRRGLRLSWLCVYQSPAVTARYNYHRFYIAAVVYLLSLGGAYAHSLV